MKFKKPSVKDVKQERAPTIKTTTSRGKERIIDRVNGNAIDYMESGGMGGWSSCGEGSRWRSFLHRNPKW
jgi:hypothetical protein